MRRPSPAFGACTSSTKMPTTYRVTGEAQPALVRPAQGRRHHHQVRKLRHEVRKKKREGGRQNDG